MVLGTGHCPGLWAAHNSGPEIPLVFYRTSCNPAFEMPFREVRELTWDDCLWSKGGCEPASTRPGSDYLAFPDDSVAYRLLPTIATPPCSLPWPARPDSQERLLVAAVCLSHGVSDQCGTAAACQKGRRELP